MWRVLSVCLGLCLSLSCLPCWARDSSPDAVSGGMTLEEWLDEAERAGAEMASLLEEQSAELERQSEILEAQSARLKKLEQEISAYESLTQDLRTRLKDKDGLLREQKRRSIRTAVRAGGWCFLGGVTVGVIAGVAVRLPP